MNLYDVGRKWLNRDVEHYGPVYRRMISPDICYFTGMFSLSHIKEIEDIEEARKICRSCAYGNLGGGTDCYV